MTPDPNQPAIDALREHLGEARFRSFVLQVRQREDFDFDKWQVRWKSMLYWQEQVLDAIEKKTRFTYPRSTEVLAQWLVDAIDPLPELAEKSVPDWIHVDQLVGGGVVQAWGRCHVASAPSAAAASWRFYFRARGCHWTLSATSDGSDPVGVDTNSESTFFHGEVYEDATSPYDAGYMPEDVARFYLVRELTRLRDRERHAG